MTDITHYFLNVKVKTVTEDIQLCAHSQMRLSISLKHDTGSSIDTRLILPKQECQLWDII